LGDLNRGEVGFLQILVGIQKLYRPFDSSPQHLDVNPQKGGRKKLQSHLGSPDMDDKSPVNPSAELVVGCGQLNQGLDEETPVLRMILPDALPNFVGLPKFVGVKKLNTSQQILLLVRRQDQSGQRSAVQLRQRFFSNPFGHGQQSASD